MVAGAVTLPAVQNGQGSCIENLGAQSSKSLDDKDDSLRCVANAAGGTEVPCPELEHLDLGAHVGDTMLYNVRNVELVGLQVWNRVWSGGHRLVGETAGVGMAYGLQSEVRELT